MFLICKQIIKSFNELFRIAMDGKEKDSIKHEILAARQSKNWKEFMKCGYKYA